MTIHSEQTSTYTLREREKKRFARDAAFSRVGTGRAEGGGDGDGNAPNISGEEAMSHRSALVQMMKLSLTCLGVAGVAGCAAGTPLPADARVETMQTDKMVLRGNAESTAESPSCKTDPLPAKHFVRLNQKTPGHVLLRPAAGQPKLELAVLHVTHLDSNRTWCVQTPADGSVASIPAEFPYGVYAISVSEGRSSTSHRYEVVFEKL